MTARSSAARSAAAKVADSPAVSSASERVRPSPPPSASSTWWSVGRTPSCPSTFHSMSVEVIHLGLGVGHDVGHLLVAEQEDDRHDDRPALEDRAVALDHLGAVREHHHDAIPRGHAQASERVREPGGGALLVQVGVLPPLEGEGDVLPVLVEAVLGQAR